MRAPSLAGAAAAGATEIGVTGAGAGREAGGGAGTAAGLGASTFAAGAGAGAAAGAAAAAPAASIVATTVLMGTVWPSAILISFRTPAEGEGISASTLSVEISKSGSSRSTLSPGFLSHLVIVPSKMLSPIWGMTTSTAMGYLSLPRETRGPAEGRGYWASKEADPFSLQRKRWPEKAGQICDLQQHSSGRDGIGAFVSNGWLENGTDEIDFLLTIGLAVRA